MNKPAQHSTFRLDRFGGSAFGLVVLCALMMLAMQSAEAQTYTVLHDFSGGLDGSDPTAGLTLVGTGNLFGGAGTKAVFRVGQTGHGWVFNPIYEFNGTDGYRLAGRLSVGPDGALYGASLGGGVGYGLIFSMRPMASICSSFACPWTESVLYQFDPIGGIDGNRPTGGLIFDASGNIYGTTTLGGMFGAGTVFQLTPSQGSWTETVLYNFGQSQSDGTSPNGNLVIDHAGNIIGTTMRGGDPDCQCGTIFQLAHNGSGWAETILHAFTLQPDGGYPSGGLVSDAAGNLYGGTPIGGSNGLGGEVYQLMPSNGGYTFQGLYSFGGDADFEGPLGIVAVDSTGNVYGTTWSQGAFAQGNVFKLTPANGGWIYTDLYDFADLSDGLNPPDGPTLDPSGNLYGTTAAGGTGGGVIWQLVP
ncbi:MAG: choice-of-anchor tandem repeat GloVer-containing protein [Candidatus Korobacteraceae bacterium]|jgi:hypothetical protein